MDSCDARRARRPLRPAPRRPAYPNAQEQELRSTLSLAISCGDFAEAAVASSDKAEQAQACVIPSFRQVPDYGKQE